MKLTLEAEVPTLELFGELIQLLRAFEQRDPDAIHMVLKADASVGAAEMLKELAKVKPEFPIRFTVKKPDMTRR